MNKKLLFSLSVCVLFIASFTVYADIYKYTAPDGKIYYSDKAKHKYYKRVIKSRPVSNTIFSGNKKVSLNIKQNKSKFDSIIQQAAIRHKVDLNLLHAVIYAESAYNPSAVSPVGAVGLMQLMPATAKRFGVTNRRDPKQNVDAGARYLKYLLGLFNSDTRLAVAAYNAGEGAVMKYKNTIPPYPETRNYVDKVMRLL